MFQTPFNISILRRAFERKLATVDIHNIRDYAHDKHRTVDDYPYGGGAGMVLKPEPIFEAVESIKDDIGQRDQELPVILLSPQGRLFSQRIALELSEHLQLILVCGHYEGVDERICQDLIEEEISIGDYVLTGGELAAMVIIDAVTRLIPGTLGGVDSAEKDSFSGGVLEHPHYTRPRIFEGAEVPAVLLSGNHQEIEKWRLETSLIRTFLKRRDLLENRLLSSQEINILEKWCRTIEKIIHNQSFHGSDALSGNQQER